MYEQLQLCTSIITEEVIIVVSIGPLAKTGQYVREN